MKEECALSFRKMDDARFLKIFNQKDESIKKKKGNESRGLFSFLINPQLTRQPS